MTTRWEYRAETRTIVTPHALGTDGEPAVIARDVDPWHGRVLAAAPALAAYVRAVERELIARRLDDTHRYAALRSLLDLFDLSTSTKGDAG